MGFSIANFWPLLKKGAKVFVNGLAFLLKRFLPLSKSDPTSTQNNHSENVGVNSNFALNNSLILGGIKIEQVQGASEGEGKEEKKRQAKIVALEVFIAAQEDLEYNGPYIGGPQAPFMLDGIRRMLAYAGSYELGSDSKSRFRNYLKNAGICNGREGGNGNVKPGFVQAQSRELKGLILKHLQERNLI